MRNMMVVRLGKTFAGLAQCRRKSESFLLISAKDLGLMIAFHGISDGVGLKADVGVRVKRTQAKNLSSNRNRFPAIRMMFKTTRLAEIVPCFGLWPKAWFLTAWCSD
jgi:hypothetical protein